MKIANMVVTLDDTGRVKFAETCDGSRVFPYRYRDYPEYFWYNAAGWYKPNYLRTLLRKGLVKWF